MKRITFTLRLTLRKLLTLLLGAAAFLFGACYRPETEYPVMYGPGPERPEPREIISGTVIGNEKPVPRFWVSILKDIGYNYTFTDQNGKFEFYIYSFESESESDNESDSYTLFFQDIDGPQNGEFNSQTVQWNSGDGPLYIVLEPKEPREPDEPEEQIPPE